MTEPMDIRDTLHVAVKLGDDAHREYLPIQTALTVRRYDTDQVAWANQRWHAAERSLALRTGGWRPGQTLTDRHFAAVGVEPYLVTHEENCNLVTLAGWAALLGSVGGTSITNKFSATNGRIGMGTGTTAVTAADTALTGDTGGASTTSYYQLCGVAPTISTASAPVTMILTAAFGNTVANFAWNEFGSDNYTASGVTTQGLGAGFFLFNHGLSAQGTKPSGQTWTATETFTAGFPSGSGTVS